MSILTKENFSIDTFDTSMMQGSISINFDETKQLISQIAESYALTQYSDDVTVVLKEMKADRAALNKMKSELDNKRKSIKATYMMPYTQFETQVKELISLLDTPIKCIDDKVKELEGEARAKKRAEIETYWRKISSGLSDEERDYLFSRIYDVSWENVTATQKAYKDGLSMGIENYVSGLAAIKKIDSDFVEEGLKKFKETLLLNDALNEINRLTKQRDEIMAREKARLEEENRRKIEAEREAIRQQAIEEERRRAAAEAKAAEEERRRAVAEAKAAAEAETNAFAAQVSPKKSDSVTFVPAPESKSLPTIAIRVLGGCITEVYSSVSDRIKIIVLDEDIASAQEVLEFEKLISDLKPQNI